MEITGDGFATFGCRIKPSFKVDTKPAIDWKQLSNGNYFAVDRGKDVDIFESTVSLYGKENVIDSFITEMNANRYVDTQYANEISLSKFNFAEQIFGAGIDYSKTIRSTIIKIKQKDQKSWRGFGLSLTLRAIDPVLSATPEIVFPLLDKMDIGYKGDSAIGIDKYDSYRGHFFYLDNQVDRGVFEAVFLFKDDEMSHLRRFLLTHRGDVIGRSSDAGAKINAIPNVTNLFGKRRTGPFDVKIIDWEDKGMERLGWWRMKLKIVEEIAV